MVFGLIGRATGIDPRLLIGGAGDAVDAVRKRADAQQAELVWLRTKTGAPRRNGPVRVGGSWQHGSAVDEIFARSGEAHKPRRSSCFPEQHNPAAGLRNPQWVAFICPLDKKVYLDTSFFQDLERRFRACDAGSKTCQFSQAHVIAHEIGHHVQNLLGLLPKVQRHSGRWARPTPIACRSGWSCKQIVFSWRLGEWAQEKWKFIEPGDVEAAMQTASAIGDDRLQQQSQGYVVPDAFTHGYFGTTYALVHRPA